MAPSARLPSRQPLRPKRARRLVAPVSVGRALDFERIAHWSTAAIPLLLGHCAYRSCTVRYSYVMLVSRAVSESSKNRRPEGTDRFGSIWTRRRPEGSRQPLSRSQIVRAAIELADAARPGCSLHRRIAAQLGAGATSLSWHVGSRDDLYELMFDAVLGEVELPASTGDWQRDLRAIARASYDVFRRHPWLVLLGIQPSLGPNTRRYGELGMRVLAEYGLDRDARTQVLAMLNNYVTGFAHRQVAWDQLRQRAGLTDEEWESDLHRYLAVPGWTTPTWRRTSRPDFTSLASRASN